MDAYNTVELAIDYLLRTDQFKRKTQNVALFFQGKVCTLDVTLFLNTVSKRFDVFLGTVCWCLSQGKATLH